MFVAVPKLVAVRTSLLPKLVVARVIPKLIMVSTVVIA